ncbi:hypothetical protein RI570_14965 [Brucella pseudogrignonensis]|uniref:hypothetical protein n=1 Tax=Brucella pseudogrignonensis TaxID=419475 RepID=UPI0028BAD0AE|nr:hypothetical protein [Brucella pseudogrignonensis]MDT6941419.1 hypothetical protein [Brucella pseudogrignonensis]
MNYVTALLIGAALGIIQFAISRLKKPIFGGHPIQAMVFMIFVGGLVYGTVIWLVAKLF